MELHVSVTFGTPITVTVSGDLDVVGAPLLRGLRSRLPHGGDLVIDLSGVTFIDCAGVGALVTTHRQTQARGGSFRLANVPPTVQRVLELTGVNLLTAGAGGRADRRRPGLVPLGQAHALDKSPRCNQEAAGCVTETWP
jgi:anti-anti-sigma factor